MVIISFAKFVLVFILLGAAARCCLYCRTGIVHANGQMLQQESATLRDDRLPLQSIHGAENSSSFRVPLHHRDGPLSPLHRHGVTEQHVLREMLERGKARVRSIYMTQRLRAYNSTDHTLSLGSDLGVVDGVGVTVAAAPYGSYVVTLGVGTPQWYLPLLIDTGSSITWTKCLPCDHCFEQTVPMFRPYDSSTFELLNCDNPYCQALQEHNRYCHQQDCLFLIKYGDGSSASGPMAEDVLELGHPGTKSLSSAPFGCSQQTTITTRLMEGAAGILGMGRAPISFPWLYLERFSYCLPEHHGRTGYLDFGASNNSPSSMGPGWMTVDLIKNPTFNSFYYVDLTGIGVNGQRLRLPEELFAIASNGLRGVIIDTGTPVARLPEDAYIALRDAFRRGSKHPRVTPVSPTVLDTCYSIGGGLTRAGVPTVDLHFDNGAVLSLSNKQVLYPKGGDVYCLAFLPKEEPEGTAIIGSIQQQGFEVRVDLALDLVSFLPNQC